MNPCYDVRLNKHIWPTCDKCSPTCRNCAYMYSSESEHCRNCKSDDMKYFSPMKHEFFCSTCGRPKTEGAWTMLEERLSMGVLFLDEGE